jgi:hypothetical protein
MIRVLDILQSNKNSKILRTALCRDLFMSSLFETKQFDARRIGNSRRVNEIARLKLAWERADKGALAKSPDGVKALRFLRQWEILGARKCSAETKLRLLEPILAEMGSVRFFQKYAEAINFRVSRKPPRVTKEGSLRADLTTLGAILRLCGRRTEATTATLHREFDPKGYKLAQRLKNSDNEEKRKRGLGIEANFRKVLRDCLILGRARGRPKKLSSTGRN